MIAGVGAGLWLGPAHGGIFLVVMAGIERFLYAQRVGDSVETGGEAGPLGQLHFLAALLFASMLFWVLFPWSLLPSSWVPERIRPGVESPLEGDWLERWGLKPEPMENPMEEWDPNP